MSKRSEGLTDDGGTMPRRAFLRRSSVPLLGLGLAALPGVAQAADARNRLVMVKHAEATDERGAGRPDIVKAMVDRAMRELTGKDSLADAWREVVSPDDVVGLKINVRAGRNLSTQPCVVDAIVAGLTAAGVKPGKIIVWDAWTHELIRAGYAINMSGEGVRYYATEKGRETPAGKKAQTAAKESLKEYYLSEPVEVAGQGVYFSKILAEEITALINVPLIKDHSVAGVTCSMKNHYGSILNPRVLHSGHCNPGIAALNAAALIKEKTRLILVDGLRALYNGGPHDKPRWRWRQNCVVAGTDPVAVDTLAMKIVEEKRAEDGMQPVAPFAKYIETAAEMGLGTNDLGQVDLREIQAG